MGESNSTTDGRSGALNTDLYVRIIKILQFPKDIGDGVLFFHFSNDWNRPQLKSRWNLSQVLRCKHYVRPHPGDYRGRSIDSNVSQRMLLQPFQFMTEAISMPATTTFQLRSQWSKAPSIWNQENRPFGHFGWKGPPICIFTLNFKTYIQGQNISSGCTKGLWKIGFFKLSTTSF